MAKEMMIVFVYDNEGCENEEDDPAAAVLYFHPTWVSDQQRLALCGQLMGITQCLTTAFSPPKILALQSGKFALKYFGRYVLAVGTDRNITDWVVEHRANTLTSLIKFFHCDLEIISQLPSLTVQHNFTQKLYHIFETYLPILQYGGNMFSNVPTIDLPKSASNIFLEAIQILQCCQNIKGSLGGTILYHNKVVATQLSSDLTKQLVITDPFRIKSPAEVISTNFHLPVGVQLLQVYVNRIEYQQLMKDASRARTLFQTIVNKKQRKTQTSKQLPKEPILSAMKRDQSIIFSTVPEEDLDHSPASQDVVIATKAKSPDRPKSLNLRTTTADLTKPDEGFVSQNFNKQFNDNITKKVTTPFTGQTSVCSTPMMERFLHGNVMSICCDPEEELEENKNNVASKLSDDKNSDNLDSSINLQDVIKPLNLSKVECDEMLLESFDKFRTASANFHMIDNFFNEKRTYSLRDIKENLKRFSKNITLKNYGIGLKKLNKNLCADLNGSEEELSPGKLFYNTITDPFYPVFRCDGLPISKYLYDDYVMKQYDLLKSENILNDTEADPETQSNIGKNFENFDSDFKHSPKHEHINYDHYESNNEVQSKTTETNIPTSKKLPDLVQIPESISENIKQRRSLSLPLKSLTSDFNSDTDESRSSSVLTPLNRKNLGGVQLTPLMSKLTVLAMDEKSSGIGSHETTPTEYRDFPFPTNEKMYSFPSTRRKSSQGDVKKSGFSQAEDLNDDKLSEEVEKAVLFICGHQNMVVMMLIENDASQDPELISKLWELCMASLEKLESHLHKCLDPCGGATTGDIGTEPYSYLCVDPRWDTVQRGGPWGVSELAVLTHLHRDFIEAPDMTEIIVRNEDSIIYGYQCGKTEIFYQQNATSNVGLPTPADLMGTVPLKARRRLERDHSIILL